MSEPLIEIHCLTTLFETDEGVFPVVNGVSFEIPKGRTLGLVGESGCGKTITGLSLVQLVPPPGRVAEGRILFHRNGQAVDLARLSPRCEEFRSIRGNEISMIFQEPMTSLNPVYSVGEQIAESLRLHRGLSRRDAASEAQYFLGRVGIPNPAQRVHEYPHQFSGGMRQRVMIAMALCCSPALLIADEPTTALDVTVQAQILSLMRQLQQEMGMSILMITHDLGIVAAMADEIVVMYAGWVVERGGPAAIFHRPKHPYTKGLLASVPVMGRRRKSRRLPTIPGTVPHPLALPPGCPFQGRCSERTSACGSELPTLVDVSEEGNGSHLARCWLYGSHEQQDV